VVLLMRQRAVMSGTNAGTDTKNFFFRTIDAHVPDGSDAVAMSARVGAFWTTVMTRLVTARKVDIEPVIDLIDEVDGSLFASFGVTPPSTISGAIAFEVGPSGLQMLLRMPTAGIVAGRRVRGRMFVGPIHLPGLEDGLYAAAETDVLEGAATDELGDDVVDGLEHVIWSRPTPAGPDHRDGTSWPVVGYEVPSSLSYRRSEAERR